MTSSELIGYSLTIALLGIAIGVFTSWLISSRAHFNDRASWQEAWQRWLAARLRLTRTSLSFVTSFRALASTRKNDHYYSLRCDEAQRTRADWCAAMTELEQAQAALTVRCQSTMLYEQVSQIRGVSATQLRQAIHGNVEHVQKFALQLRGLDDTAVSLTRMNTTLSAPRRRGIKPRLVNGAIWLQALANGRVKQARPDRRKRSD